MTNKLENFLGREPTAGRKLSFQLVRYENRSWGAKWLKDEVGFQTFSCATWDEMLWWLIEAIQRGRLIADSDAMAGLMCEEASEYEDNPWEVVETIDVFTIDGTWWNAENDGKFISNLQANEVFGFLAKYMLDGQGLFGGFKTYEQWFRAMYRSRQPVAAIIHGSKGQ